MVPDHGFASVGTMQVQAIMPPLMPTLLLANDLRNRYIRISWGELVSVKVSLALHQKILRI